MSTVADPSDAVTAMQPDRDLARALLGGTRAMRAAGVTYLPQWPNEEATAYTARLATAVLFPAYSRTVATLAGKPFSKALTFGEDVPPRIVEWCEDVDLQGRSLQVFAAEQMQKVLGYGLAGILVDYPRAEGVRTLADERSVGARPYFVAIEASQILGWRAQMVAGKWRLLQLRIMESVAEPDGEWGETEIAQVRVMTPGAWQTYRSNDKGLWSLHEQGATTLSEIPFVALYGDRTGFMTAKPPLIEVAHLNVQHWQSSSDQQTILHVARVPILTAIGVDEDFTLTVGASSAVKITNPEGKLAYVEHSGAAITAGRDDLKDIEERMRQAGAELLVLQPGQITATQVATENAVGMSALQRIAVDFEDGLAAALQFMADWVNEPQGGHVQLFKDFASATLAEASAQLLLTTATAGKLSDETLIGEYKRRGILAPEIDHEEERERIAAQGPALGTMGDEGDVAPPARVSTPAGA